MGTGCSPLPLVVRERRPHHTTTLPKMTAQKIRHIASLAHQRALALGPDASLEQWHAVVALRQLAWSVADREIAAQGYSNICAPLA